MINVSYLVKKASRGLVMINLSYLVTQVPWGRGRGFQSFVVPTHLVH